MSLHLVSLYLGRKVTLWVSCRTELSALSVHSLMWVPLAHSFVNKPSPIRKISTQPTERGKKKKFSNDIACQAELMNPSPCSGLWPFCDFTSYPPGLVSSPVTFACFAHFAPATRVLSFLRQNQTDVPRLKALCTLLFPLPNPLLRSCSF